MRRTYRKLKIPTAVDKGEIIKIVTAYKQLLAEHLKLDSVYLFGSYAEGSNREDSDIDVAVVLQNVHEDFFTINPLLWKLRRQIDSRIEPVLIDKYDDRSGFWEQVQHSGIRIP